MIESPSNQQAELTFQAIQQTKVNLYNCVFQMNTTVTTDNLSQQIEHYILELQGIQHQASRSNQPHLALLQSKISAKIAHFQNAVQTLRYNDHTPAALKKLSSHLSVSFSQIVKEAHRLLQLKSTQDGAGKLKNKLDFLNLMEEEMNDEWQGNLKTKQHKILRKIDENKSMLADHVDQKNLKGLAKEYLNKEFLTIRMVAYRMYQTYTGHQHSQIRSKLKELTKQQEELSTQAQQLADYNRNLRAEQKRLALELQELKRTNELIGNRYFVSNAQEGSP